MSRARVSASVNDHHCYMSDSLSTRIVIVTISSWGAVSHLDKAKRQHLPARMRWFTDSPTSILMIVALLVKESLDTMWHLDDGQYAVSLSCRRT